MDSQESGSIQTYFKTKEAELGKDKIQMANDSVQAAYKIVESGIDDKTIVIEEAKHIDPPPRQQSREPPKPSIHDLKPLSSSVDNRVSYKELVKLSKEMDERKERTKREQEQRSQKQIEEDRRREKEQADEQKRQRAQKAEQRLQEIKLRQGRREEEIREGNERIKDYLKQEKKQQLFKQMMEQREAQDALLERKQRLEQIRDLHRPVTKQEILEHQRRVEEQSKKIEEAKTQEKQKHQKTDGKQYQYHDAYIKAEQEKAKLQHEEALKRINKKEMLDRKRQFAIEVKEKFRPPVSEEKQLELRALQERVHHKPNFKGYKYVSENLRRKKLVLGARESASVDRDDEEVDDFEQINFQGIETSSLVDQKELGNQYLQYSKTQNKRKRHNETHLSYDAYEVNDRIKQEQERVDKNATKKIDYLKVLHDQLPERDVLNDWQKVKLNQRMDEQSRNEKILAEAKKLELMAKRKEELAKHKHRRDKDDDNIDAYYIGAIKAKLEVLEH